MFPPSRRTTGRNASSSNHRESPPVPEIRRTQAPEQRREPTVMRKTMHLPAAVRSALKRLALDNDTTMSGLIRIAITTGLHDTTTLTTASLQHHRTRTGVRTTLDISYTLHRQLKVLAADKDTSVQALIYASILLAYPELK